MGASITDLAMNVNNAMNSAVQQLFILGATSTPPEFFKPGRSFRKTKKQREEEKIRAAKLKGTRTRIEEILLEAGLVDEDLREMFGLYNYDYD